MDVLCEKPMTRFVAEGRAVVNAFKRYGRVFQIGTFGRFGRSKDKGSVLKHKIMTSGLLKDCQAVRMKKGGLKVKQWSGTPGIPHRPFPINWIGICIAALSLETLREPAHRRHSSRILGLRRRWHVRHGSAPLRSRTVDLWEGPHQSG